MKRGLTMIELVFVIVILGIMASVAIPKLMSTRDDAKYAKALSDIRILVNDLVSYRVGHTRFASEEFYNQTLGYYEATAIDDFKKITNIKIDAYSSGIHTFYYQIDTNCYLHISISENQIGSSSGESSDYTNSGIDVYPSSSLNSPRMNDDKCISFFSLKPVREFFSGFVYDSSGKVDPTEYHTIETGVRSKIKR